MILFSTWALAGKLALGWRGHTPGDATDILANKPDASCTKDPEEGVAWRCAEPIGSATVLVHYMVDAPTHLFMGVFILCDNYTNCTALRDALDSAWGKGDVQPGRTMPDTTWTEGTALAAWAYNTFSDTGKLSVIDMRLHAQVKAAQKEAAKKAAESL